MNLAAVTLRRPLIPDMNLPVGSGMHSGKSLVFPRGGYMPRDEILCMNLKSPVGDMIAGATEKGVCFLEWHSRGGVDTIKSRIEKRYQLPLKEEKNKQ